MRAIGILGVSLAALAMAAYPVLARADNMTVKNASGSTITVASKTVSSVEHPEHALEGYDGTALHIVSVDSSGRIVLAPTTSILIGGTLPAFATTPTFNCGTGCSAGTGTAQGATLTGLTGSLPLWSVTTGAPTYTTGTVQPPSLTTGGLLRVDASGAAVGVTGTFWQTTQPVSGTFWQATQPVSAASLPLPTGAATAAKQPALGTAGTSSADVITVQGRASMTPLLVDPSGVTSPVSLASVPLATGAATAAKQPALGTAGSSSTDVISVQGVASGTALPVSFSGTPSMNEAQINGVAPLMGNGVTGTGSQRVTIASDNTAFGVIAGGSVADASAASGNPVPMGGIYETAPPTYTTGQRATLHTGTRGGVRTELYGADSIVAVATFADNADALTTSSGARLLGVQSRNMVYNGTSYERSRGILDFTGGAAGTGVQAVEHAGASFNHITTATTTTVKASAGILHTVCINTVVSSATVTLYNNTTATAPVIGVITNPSVLLQMGPLCSTYDVSFSTGLTIVTTGAQDITVTYR